MAYPPVNDGMPGATDRPGTTTVARPEGNGDNARPDNSTGRFALKNNSARENYLVSASSRRTSSGTVPTLKVVRLSDKRVIYPFQGCADMPLFEDANEAKQFADDYGWQLVDGDIAVPEK